MNVIFDRLFDHLIPEVGGVSVFVDNETGKVTKKCIVKYITGDGREGTVRNPTHLRPSQSKNEMRIRKLRKNPDYRASENERKRH